MTSAGQPDQPDPVTPEDRGALAALDLAMLVKEALRYGPHVTRLRDPARRVAGAAGIEADDDTDHAADKLLLLISPPPDVPAAVTSEPRRGVTGRGFAIYDQFTDTYGAQVRVQESSAATGPRCWIFCLDAHDAAAAPHLDPDGARRVRAALAEFLTAAGEPLATFGQPDPDPEPWHAYCSRCGDCLVCQGAAECTRGGDHELELSWAIADRDTGP